MPGFDSDTIRRLNALHKQQQDLARMVLRQIKPVLDAQVASINRALAGIAQSRDLMAQALRSVRTPELQVQLPKGVTPQLAELQALILQSFGPALESIRRAARLLPTVTRDALMTLGNHGWYLDPSLAMQLLWELQSVLEQGDVENADRILCEYFEERLDAIEESLRQRFPHRAHLLSAAFDAHRRRQYELAIPVFLAQTDGICADLTSRYLFLRQDGKPETAHYVETVAADALQAAILSPLAEVLPIGMSRRERPDGFDALNRHMVMHGESLDYGTRLNSLKAISLLNYVSEVLEGAS
jgi:hypothetical protein